MKEWKAFLYEEEAVSTVEIILILVVLVAAVILFKNQITSLVTSILNKVTKQSKTI